MKYAKKMKLVDIGEVSAIEKNYSSGIISDSDYVQPRMLSSLDRVMRGILERKDLDDGSKWTLYNQTLHRYLNFVKNQQNQQPQQQSLQSENDHQLIDSSLDLNHSFNSIDFTTTDSNTTDFNHTFNRSIDSSKGSSSNSRISGINPLRDSLDSIAAPKVREFFANVRDNAANTVPSDVPERELSQMSMDISEFSSAKPAEKSKTTSKTGRQKRRARNVPYNRFQHYMGNPTKPRALAKRHNESIFNPPRSSKLLITGWTPTSAK